MSSGTPVIRPMYLSKFNEEAKAKDTINTMYMFGPAVLA
jgi:alpha-glucosidase (family GH31 glycosyl hydrolase)